ncbi:MAG TPA: acyl-CoA dehydrogenase family protein [Acidimicrobiales bacterium]|nr:acyl-CoA dehydrogenase family protein [Acidimicrobiales bacterium]
MTTVHAPTPPTTPDLLDAVASIASGLRTTAPGFDRTGELDVEAFERLRAAGVTAALVPRVFGGAGVTHAEMGEILRVLGASDPAVAVTLAMHSHLVAAQVWRHQHGIDAEPFLRKVAAGAIAISTGASDWIASNGTATKVEGGFRVSARKSPASGCEVGDLLVTSVHYPGAEPKVIHFAIPFTAEGLTIERTWDTLGLRATGSHTVVLNEVFVPEAAVSLTRPATEWHPVWNTILGAALPLIMAAYVGIADAAVERAIELASGRDDDHVHQLAGEMLNAYTVGADTVRAMFLDADDLRFDNSNAIAARMLTRKTTATDALIHTVRLAIELVGGVGFTRASALERLYRDIHGSLFHPLPRAKQTRLTGRVALGLAPVA